MEQSTKGFREFKDCFFHRFRQCSDTGLELNLLQNYIFIALDIFKLYLRDRGMETERDAWLAFLIQ